MLSGLDRVLRGVCVSHNPLHLHHYVSGPLTWLLVKQMCNAKGGVLAGANQIKEVGAARGCFLCPIARQVCTNQNGACSWTNKCIGQEELTVQYEKGTHLQQGTLVLITTCRILYPAAGMDVHQSKGFIYFRQDTCALAKSQPTRGFLPPCNKLVTSWIAVQATEL